MAPAERAEWDSGVGAATAAFAGLYRYHPAVAAALRAWALTRPGGALLFWAVLRPLALNAKRTMAAPDAACLDRDHPEYFGVRLQALLAQGLQTPLGQGWQTSLGQGVQAAMGAPTQRVPRGGPRRTTTPLSLSSRAAGEGSRCSARGRGRSACMRSNSLHVIGQCWERRRTAMQARSCHMQMRSRTLQWCLSGTLVAQAGQSRVRERCISGGGMHLGSAVRPNSNNQRPHPTSQTPVRRCTARRLRAYGPVLPLATMPVSC